MVFSFKQFHFDNKQQLLTKHGSVIPLNEKALHLLVLFLENPSKIHSKSDILEAVWPDKYVSDQVVFQNISQLRTLIGKDAIKTFPKKGYQWQLPLTPINHQQVNEKFTNIPPQEITEQSVIKRPDEVSKKIMPKLIYVAIPMAILVILSVTLINKNTESESLLSPKLNNHPTAVFTFTNAHNQQNAEFLALKLTSQEVFDSPYITWKKHSKNRILVATKSYILEQGVALRFHIQGAARGWHNYIWAENITQAHHQLNKLLKLLNSTNYLNTPSSQSALAELTLLANKTQHNELIQQQLIRQYVALDDLNKASAQFTQQVNSATSELHRGLLHLLNANIQLKSQHWLDARHSAAKANHIFQTLGLAQLEASALIVSSWTYMTNSELLLGVQTLNQSISKARASTEPLLEVKALITQSFFAFKDGQRDMAFSLIDLAKEMIKFHHLDEVHYVRVHNNLAWMSENEATRLNHNQAILNLPFSPQYELYFYEAAKSVLNSHIQNKQWDLAQSTIKTWQRLSFQLLSKARIAFAKGNVQQVVYYSEKAYQQAQIDFHKVDALDAALFILENQQGAANETHAQAYIAFIQQNSTPRWQQQNQGALKQLNFPKI